MKTKIPSQTASLATILLFIICFPFRAPAPVGGHIYSIDWFKVAGGGDTSTGGVYAVSGTIGQPDASGGLTGGRYGVVGGYWAMFAVVPTPGAPLLTITLTHTNTAVVSWPFPSTGWNLQQNTNLASTSWVASPASTDNGTINYIIVNPPTGNRYYRLKQ